MKRYRQLTVRYYRGIAVPWKVHDCTEAENCPFCKKQKRLFAAAQKAEQERSLK